MRGLVKKNHTRIFKFYHGTGNHRNPGGGSKCSTTHSTFFIIKIHRYVNSTHPTHLHKKIFTQICNTKSQAAWHCLCSERALETTEQPTRTDEIVERSIVRGVTSQMRPRWLWRRLYRTGHTRSRRLRFSMGQKKNESSLSSLHFLTGPLCLTLGSSIRSMIICGCMTVGSILTLGGETSSEPTVVRREVEPWGSMRRGL